MGEGRKLHVPVGSEERAAWRLTHDGRAEPRPDSDKTSPPVPLSADGRWCVGHDGHPLVRLETDAEADARESALAERMRVRDGKLPAWARGGGEERAPARKKTPRASKRLTRDNGGE